MSVFSIFGKTYSSDIGGSQAYYSTFSSLSPIKQKLWLPLFMLGIVFLLLGVLLIIHPELLAFFFAGILMFIGICIVSSSLFIRKSAKHNIHIK